MKPWIFGANALIFDRIDNEYVRLSSRFIAGGGPGNNVPTTLSTFDARMGHAAGFEVFGGRYFGCGKYAIIGSYWGLFQATRNAWYWILKVILRLHQPAIIFSRIFLSERWDRRESRYQKDLKCRAVAT